MSEITDDKKSVSKVNVFFSLQILLIVDCLQIKYSSITRPSTDAGKNKQKNKKKVFQVSLQIAVDCLRINEMDFCEQF